MGSSSDANDAIRISCPLDRITSVSYSHSKRLASIRVEPTPSDTNHGEFSDSQEAQVFHMATVMVVDAWEHLEKYISAAKQRTAYQAPNLQSRVFLDFGSLSFSEVGALTYNRDDSSHKEKAVRHALALDAEPEVWSQSLLFPSPPRKYCINESFHQLPALGSLAVLLPLGGLSYLHTTSVSGANRALDRTSSTVWLPPL